MKITLKIAAWNEANGFQFAVLGEKNRAELERFFTSTEEDVEVCVINEVEKLNYRREVPHLELAVKYMLLDIKDDDSALRKKFQYTEKLEFARALLFLTLRERMSAGRKSREGMTDYDAFYGRKGLHFRAYIPKKSLTEMYHTDMPVTVDANEIPKEDFIRGVLTWYYNELAAWDREKLRNDADEMKYLREHWIESLDLALA